MNKGWFPHTYVQQFVVRTFRNREPSEVAFVLPQVVSMLRYDHQGILEDYLKQTAVGYPLFLHQLIWEISTAITDEVGCDSVHPQCCTMLCVQDLSLAVFLMGVSAQVTMTEWGEGVHFWGCAEGGGVHAAEAAGD